MQKADLLAWIGNSLAHSGHRLVVGSAGGCLRARATKVLIADTTAKQTAATIITKDALPLTKSPVSTHYVADLHCWLPAQILSFISQKPHRSGASTKGEPEVKGATKWTYRGAR